MTAAGQPEKQTAVTSLGSAPAGASLPGLRETAGHWSSHGVCGVTPMSADLWSDLPRLQLIRWSSFCPNVRLSEWPSTSLTNVQSPYPHPPTTLLVPQYHPHAYI
ncbi:hypothetical protein ElyMa_000105300 [Elysia marginata]|uniref:Uncharacterized protein n=1 Tax=Elysia marginata TaxID=1093978 RepID=A0AAV4ELN1_9GAST|nr:hypothetical protein ElyMa_000105300 [Elysia marginata]